MIAHVPLLIDTRAAQIARLADAMEANPGSTIPESDAIAHTGSASKCIADMRELGFDIIDKWSLVIEGGIPRPRKRYWLIARPTHAQQDLFPRA